MGKLQGRDKLILAFMAAGVMLGTAWAADVAYKSGDSKALGDIVTDSILSPSANGSNKLTLTGKEGESASNRSDKNFVIYGASATSPEIPRLSWTGRRNCIPRARCSFSPEATARM